MLTKMRVTQGANVLELPFDDSTEAYYVTDIQGLGAKQNILTQDALYIPGGSYLGATSPARNIVLKLAHKNRFVSLSQRRMELVQYFQQGRPVNLQFDSDDMPTVQTIGSVETIETELFTKDPAIVISIVCQLVPFYGMSEVAPLAVPFSGSTVNKIVNYEGTTPVGFKVSFEPWTAFITVSNVDRNEILYQTNNADYTGAGWVRGRLSTVPGNRYFDVISASGSIGTAPDALSSQSKWPKLYPGVNNLQFKGLNSAITITDFKYAPLYEGV